MKIASVVMMTLIALAVPISFEAQHQVARSNPEPPSSVFSLTRDLPCSHFDWTKDESGQHGAMIVPITLNGRTYKFQLDTGADVVITYGKDLQPGWTHYGDHALRIPNVYFAGSSFPAILAFPMPSMDADEIQGTIGLDLFIGRTLILDFPAQRVCLVERGDLPLSIEQTASWNYGEIGKTGKFFIPATLSGLAVPRLLYDSGSSPAAVDVDLSLWKSVTGRASTTGTPMSKPFSAWGKELHNVGANAIGNLVLNGYRDLPNTETPTVAPITFPHPLVTTTVERSTYYRTELDGDGVLGNALFPNDILVLDLGAHPRLGIITPSVKGAGSR